MTENMMRYEKNDKAKKLNIIADMKKPSVIQSLLCERRFSLVAPARMLLL